VELPEKQGLKLIEQGTLAAYKEVAVELPEKQGLKQDNSPCPAFMSKKLQWNFQKNKD